MKVIVLAAGYATRLWPLTLNRPKPLLLIGKHPMLEHIIARLRPIKEINDIYVITNTKFVKNFKEWKKSYKCSKRISVIDDKMKTLKERRGSIGDTLFAIENKKIKDGTIVVAGDNLFDFDLGDFVRTAKKNSPSATIGLFDIRDKVLAREYGIVALDHNSKVVSFEEKPKKPKSTLAAMCFYYFPKEKLNAIKIYRKDGNPLDLAGSFIKWLAKKEDVYGYVFKGRWLDIGDKKSLKKAEKINWG